MLGTVLYFNYAFCMHKNIRDCSNRKDNDSAGFRCGLLQEYFPRFGGSGYDQNSPERNIINIA